MKVLMLSWEYPPKLVGGLARHVMELSEALVTLGHEVHVLTVHADGCPQDEEMNGVMVHRVNPSGPSSKDIVDSAMLLNLNFMEAAIQLMRQGHVFDLIHAHDWLAAFAAKGLKYSWKRPMVATIHATEFGRNHGLHNDLQRRISNVEWWLTYEAWRVICCSDFMKGEISYVFQTPQDKIAVIPNGVHVDRLRRPPAEEMEGFRQQYAADDEKIVFFLGRLVHEKGGGVLIDAVPEVLRRHNATKFIIAGSGPSEGYLRQRAAELGIANRVYFVGHVDDVLRNKLFAISDVAVFPSLYEPFGIVALEAMAAKVPVVVSDTGGFAQIVRHGDNGYKAYPGNVQSLADNLVAALKAEEFSAKLAANAYAEVATKYSWATIARQTEELYRVVMEEFARSEWRSERDGVDLAVLARLGQWFQEEIPERYTSTEEEYVAARQAVVH
ncbi:MAG: glycosyltransferase family 4 protein [Firmicutes bacterium]|nr:glycosyltransferase family 4 protein [Bacillota bacterium]